MLAAHLEVRPHNFLGHPDAEGTVRVHEIGHGLKWATTFLEDSDSALVYAIEGGYDADDYVVAHRHVRDGIPAATWRWVIKAVSPEEVHWLGFAAYSRGELGVSVQAWQRAGDEANSLTAAQALLFRGAVLDQQRQPEQAIAAYEEVERRFGQAEETALQEPLAKALFNKGVLLRQQGQPEQAIAAYNEVERRFGQAEETAPQEQLAKALFKKGVLLRAQGQAKQAIAAFQKVERRFGQAEEPALQNVVVASRENRARLE